MEVRFFGGLKDFFFRSGFQLSLFQTVCRFKHSGVKLQNFWIAAKQSDQASRCYLCYLNSYTPHHPYPRKATLQLMS